MFISRKIATEHKPKPKAKPKLKLLFEKFVHRSTGLLVKDDFFAVPSSQLSSFSSVPSVMSRYHSFSRFLISVYPFFSWNRISFTKTTKLFSERKNRFFMEQVARDVPFGFGRQLDFRYLDSNKVKNYYSGEYFLKKNKSWWNILSSSYPMFFWHLWKWPNSDGMEKKRIFLDAFVMNYLEWVEVLGDMNEIRTRDVNCFPGGATLLTLNHGSVVEIFSLIYRELVFKVMIGIESEEWMKRNFLDQFLLNYFTFVDTQMDLVDVLKDEFVQYSGGSSLLELYNWSRSNMINNIYPEFSTKFQRVKRGYWSNTKELLNLILKVIKTYHIQSKGDWYRLSMNQFSLAVGSCVSKKTIINLLDYWYPEEDWEYIKFSDMIHKRARQKFLGVRLKEIFQNQTILEEYTFKFSNHLLVFDFYLPKQGLVIEYQGEQHYFDSLKWVSTHNLKQRDQLKKHLCQQNGLQLIHVPYWWDNSLLSLKQMLHINI